MKVDLIKNNNSYSYNQKYFVACVSLLRYVVVLVVVVSVVVVVVCVRWGVGGGVHACVRGSV